ncbi:2-C-methyl-D-erythritol 2,4-cyclodiphosphate synthase [Hasllibacter halocynthiae]|uniref:Bifunctional enzyme IspD/IspF n=1 Tax=Hasllibacter halocynthiae TaxID=595589 RepID=A0A2T0X8B2_9RHOB|nr:2-C-methyl-D-erythritol 4-phosphate cytidylyltransferase [Hasllibacter halocynthiae]PRY95173.1 2-C-methyl-D-erythritol 2,4-cyclodiphosphate synthase [Hasllibacter halocynthiae]
MEAWAVIVAAGRGTRIGGEPKQWRMVGGRTVLERAVEAFEDHPGIAGVVVVLHPDDAPLPGRRCVPGGATRALSVRAGLDALPETAEAVLVHDGARPLVSAELIARVIDGVRGAGAAAPALPVTDALWRGGAVVAEAVPRNDLWRAQTPQGFRLTLLRGGHAGADGTEADDVEVVRKAGAEVAIVPGDEENLKITHPEDFTRAEAVLRARAPGPDVRMGTGFDVHAFGGPGPVVLCGVEVEHPKGLKGHSDADVGLHTLADAIYGALAEGDIGRHFPPSDPRWKGEPSETFLSHAAGLARRRGYGISNLDLTLICEAPKIGPHAEAMRGQVARIAGLEVGRVSVKATTTERLGFAGRAEGIAAQAAATLVRA